MENFSQFTPFLLMFAVIYFFMIAPQMRKSKKERKFLIDLKTGDRVVMKSGMHGRVNHINKKEELVLLKQQLVN